MEDPKKMGLIFGSFGTILGGVLWLVILGVVLKSLLLILVPFLLGIVCFILVVVLSNRYPEKYLAILGMVIVFITFINLLFVNLFFDKIPDTIGGITTGKAGFNIIQINLLLGAMLLIGFFLSLKDILKKKIPFFLF